MKRIFALITLLFFCTVSFAQEVVSESENKNSVPSEWNQSIGLGLTFPFKMIFIDGNKSTGFSTQINVTYEEKKSSGLIFFVDAAIGPYFYNDLHIGDSSGLCFNMSILFCGGYDFLANDKDNSLILAAVFGIDFFTFKNYINSNGRFCKENSAVCFDLGFDLVYTFKLKENLKLYMGWKTLAGAGWNYSRVTEDDKTEDKEKVVSDDYGSSCLLAVQPKIGLLYKY